MEKVVKAQGVFVASVLLALVSLSVLPGAASLTSPAGRGPSTQCDCETR